MPIVDVTLLAGRSPEVKRTLLRELTDTIERVLAVRRDTIRVLLHEVPHAHWAVGGEPISEQPLTLDRDPA